ncbi:MAG: DUF559 domain-containing protein [Archangium sp.]|nr:DUF559 domain-containing protein [Archangium sp.]
MAGTQHGVISRKQALECGLTPRELSRRCTARRFVRVFPTVFRIEGAPETYHQQLKALSLWLGSGFAISHRTAARLHGFARFSDEEVIEAVCTRNVRKRKGAKVHRIDSLDHRDVSSIDGLRVTSPTKTILALAPTLAEHDLRSMLDEALRRKWTTLDRLESALKKVGELRSEFGALARLIHEYQGGDGPTESELESMTLELIDMAGLPRPVKQRSVVVNGRVRRLDFWWPDFKIVLEVDGYAHHSSPRSFEDDRRRNNALVTRGCLVLHWTWQLIQDEPEHLIEELQRCMARRA